MHRLVLEYKYKLVDGDLRIVDATFDNVMDAISAGHEVVLVDSNGYRYHMSHVSVDTDAEFMNVRIVRTPSDMLTVHKLYLTRERLVSEMLTINP